MARRPGRFGVAIPTAKRAPIWFASKPGRPLLRPDSPGVEDSIVFPVIVAAPGATQPALCNYIGSVSTDAGGGIVVASTPKGGLITFWDIGTRQFLGSCELNDGCDIAPTRHKTSSLLTSGQGWLVETDVKATPDEERR